MFRKRLESGMRGLAALNDASSTVNTVAAFNYDLNFGCISMSHSRWVGFRSQISRNVNKGKLP